jgi:CheY-like chemotaxis protein
MKTKILVVDDKDENINAARNQFAHKNVELICCSKFSTASKLLKEQKFDMLLTDLMMPGESMGISHNNPEIGKEVPYGLVLCLMAKNHGVSHVAILTDINHHSGPIASAMDNLLGENQCISGFPNKNWIAAAEKFVSIEEEECVSMSEDCLLFIGQNDGFKDCIVKNIKSNIKIISLSRDDIKNHLNKFIDIKPTFTLLIGELSEEAKSTSFYVKDLFDGILSVKTSEQKILVTGWMEYDNPYYKRLPLDIAHLMEEFNHR